ncbi:hypothetical protein B5E53_16910 [Eubacterium sp. An11]|uniref:DUF6273 domain-containing protein n=1 Tax=Eubacterium sp. An11 TaxID=1965542 RepID=UPI000B38BEFE|nr:DUF6273 domain-containing protein [Eubacterium sp. An11]OUQ62903.1 hypothetical protein B5E53_16910 [Eubacterium sp. An11]
MNKMVARVLAGMLTAIICAITAVSMGNYKGMIKKVEAATVVNNPRIVPDSSMEAGQKVTWDCIWFGNYPQTEVVLEGSEEESRLEKMAASYGITYESVDSNTYTSIEDANYNSNDDTVINGVKYRRLKGKDAHSQLSYDWGDDYEKYHYFRYEPIKWRILDIDNNAVLLLSDLILDSRYYTETFNADNELAPSMYDYTWETSTIRSWLNGYDDTKNVSSINYEYNNFINAAFSSQEQNNIIISEVINENSLTLGIEGGNDTLDKIFLLSESEVYATDQAISYGFIKDYESYDEAKDIKCSTYGLARGMKRFSWLLRSPTNTTGGGAAACGSEYIGEWLVTISAKPGVRPALRINLTSSDLYSYAGTICSDGTIVEVAAGAEDIETNPGQKPTNPNDTQIPSGSNSTSTSGNKNSQMNNAMKADSWTKTRITSPDENTLGKKGKLKAVKSTKKRTVKITWKKLKGITGYQVYISRKKDFSRETFERIYKKKKTTGIITGLKSKKKYYVKVRPYKKKGKKTYYGAWSKTKKVKVK